MTLVMRRWHGSKAKQVYRVRTMRENRVLRRHATVRGYYVRQYGHSNLPETFPGWRCTQQWKESLREGTSATQQACEKCGWLFHLTDTKNDRRRRQNHS